MELLGFFFTLCLAWCIGFIFWMEHTKSGKKWLEEL